VLEMHCAHARYVYNLGLEQRSMWRRGMKSVGVYEQKRQLTEARAEFDWLRAGATVVQQQALFDLDRAFTNFFDACKGKGRAKYPTFKRRGINEGFAVRDVNVRRVSRRVGVVFIPKLGWVRFRAHRDWSLYGAATSARVSLRNGQWHIAFTTPPPAKIEARTGAVVGIDRGVANTIATSDGVLLHIPGLTPGEQRRFLMLQQRLARQTRAAKKGGRRFDDCARRRATIAGLATIRRRLDNRRTDWVEQTTTRLARSYDMVALEALNTTGMVRRPTPKPDPDRPGVFLPNHARAKASLNRLILASRWGGIHRRLTDKMPEGAVVIVDPRNTSRTCANPSCGHVAAENRESQAVFVCVACGYHAHADINAAGIILTRALNPNPRTSGDRTQKSPRTQSRVNQPEAVA
jgi:putative transposase